jgi:peptidoglycan/LPS O-acetylase OafA/YrhL
MKRLPTLDGWRAVAIAAVVLHHLTQSFYQRESDYGASLTRFGAFGVDIFFGLSGLLITKLLLDVRRRSDSFDLRGFYIRRAFRILPPYLIFLGVLTAAGLWRSGWEAASCLLFFRNYAPDSLVGENTQHLWSLAVEEHFYLLWPGLLAWFGARRSKGIAITLALGVALWRMIESQFTTPLLPFLPQHFRTDLRLDALLWGCAVAFLLDDSVQRKQLVKQLRFGVWVAMAGLLGLSIVYYSQMSSVMVAVLIPILLAGTMTNPEWRLSRALELAPVAWLGRISYSLYLWQQLFLVPGWQHPDKWWQQWPANLPVSFGLAIGSYYFIEKPLIRMGRGLARLPEPAPIQSVVRNPSEPASGLERGFL